MKSLSSTPRPASDGSDVLGPVGAGHGPAALVREMARDLLRQRRLQVSEAARVETGLRDHDWTAVRNVIDLALARSPAPAVATPAAAPATRPANAVPAPSPDAPQGARVLRPVPSGDAGAPDPAGEDARNAEALLRVVMRLCDALPRLVVHDPGLADRLVPVRMLLGARLTRDRIEEVDARLSAVLDQQIAFQQEMQEARTSVKDMLGVLVERLASVGTSTARFQNRISAHRAALGGQPAPQVLLQVVEGLLADTREVSEEIEQSQAELAEARRKVESYELRVRALEQELANASRLVQNDPLTHALNRRGLDEVFRVEASRAARYRVPLTVVMIDLDDFKTINDTLGHAGGDRALVHFVTTAQACLRSTELIARTGGEEFVVAFPATPTQSAVDAMRRLQRELARNAFVHDGHSRLMTFSGGATTWVEGESLAQTLQRADAAMYAAKRAGKNRVVIAG